MTPRSRRFSLGAVVARLEWCGRLRDTRDCPDPACPPTRAARAKAQELLGRNGTLIDELAYCFYRAARSGIMIARARETGVDARGNRIYL